MGGRHLLTNRCSSILQSSAPCPGKPWATSDTTCCSSVIYRFAEFDTRYNGSRERDRRRRQHQSRLSFSSAKRFRRKSWVQVHRKVSHRTRRELHHDRRKYTTTLRIYNNLHTKFFLLSGFTFQYTTFVGSILVLMFCHPIRQF